MTANDDYLHGITRDLLVELVTWAETVMPIVAPLLDGYQPPAKRTSIRQFKSALDRSRQFLDQNQRRT